VAVAPSREAAADAATRRPVGPPTNPYSKEFVKVIGLFHDARAARQAKADLLAADLPIGGIRIEPVGLVQDLTPPSVYNPRRGLWEQCKCRLLGCAAPDHSADGLSPDARVMVTVVPESDAREVAAIQARHGALDTAPYIRWAPRARRSARPPAHEAPTRWRPISNAFAAGSTRAH
jgi:hypothetical protein